VYKRLRGVKEALESKADTPEDVDEKLRLLENLTEIVENIDYAKGELFSLCGVFCPALHCHPMRRKQAHGNMKDSVAKASR